MIDQLTGRVEEAMAPFRDALDLLDTIPGINQATAEVIIAETGGDIPVAQAARQLLEDVALALGQGGPRTAHLGQHPVGDRSRQCGAAGRRVADRREQLLRPFGLEQVAGGARFDGAGDVGVGVEHGEHQHAWARRV
jgi:hypothetical protein